MSDRNVFKQDLDLLRRIYAEQMKDVRRVHGERLPSEDERYKSQLQRKIKPSKI